MKSKSYIFVVVGTPGSGKDLLIQAVNDMGVLHCRIVPKHTSRNRQPDDSNEMICCDDKGYDLENCDIVYNNYNDDYGIKTSLIWEQLKLEVIQVLVVSNISAINELNKIFGSMIKLIFVHSQLDVEKYISEQKELGNDHSYYEPRVKAFNDALDIYCRNIDNFDHVLIYADSKEDLFDQIFRLFNFYETS